jgi:phosphonate transport system ATP-binding protein
MAPASSVCVHVEGMRCELTGGRIVLDVPWLQLQSGQHVALIGPNGAGKSMFLRCLTGFAKPTSGQVQVLGRELGEPRGLRGAPLRGLRAEVGQVLQGLHLVQRVSVLDNVLMGALGRLRGVQAWHSWARSFATTEHEQAHRALAAVGLAGRAEERADRLSGGERQKVAIARMLMQHPRLILADEPTANLDPAAAQEICALLRQAAGTATLITVVHDPALLPLLAGRVIGLRHGRVMFDCTLASLSQKDLKDLYASPDLLRIT